MIRRVESPPSTRNASLAKMSHVRDAFRAGDNAKRILFPADFPQSRETQPETGSLWTGSTTIQIKDLIGKSLPAARFVAENFLIRDGESAARAAIVHCLLRQSGAGKPMRSAAGRTAKERDRAATGRPPLAHFPTKLFHASGLKPTVRRPSASRTGRLIMVG